MPSHRNQAILAVAGGRKTQLIIDRVCAAGPERRLLVATYTRENLQQIRERIIAAVGTVPPNVSLLSWYQFLLQDGARPYQRAVLGEAKRVEGINFEAKKPRYAAKASGWKYFMEASGRLYQDQVSAFVVEADTRSNGAVGRRIGDVYDEILVDEVQDLVGHDLEVLTVLFRCGPEVTVVGDPRQHLYATNRSNKNRSFRGAGIIDWLSSQSEICSIVEMTTSYRCAPRICEFASALFPEFAALTSGCEDDGPEGEIVQVPKGELAEYLERVRPVCLRYAVNTDTCGVAAVNIGIVKGRTFDHVLLFPTKTMVDYLGHGDPGRLATREKLYVAATRARFSFAIVV